MYPKHPIKLLPPNNWSAQYLIHNIFMPFYLAFYFFHVIKQQPSRSNACIDSTLQIATWCMTGKHQENPLQVHIIECVCTTCFLIVTTHHSVFMHYFF